MTRVYLVRHAVHGLVDRVLAGRMAGVHLSDEGRAQALRLAGHFGDTPVARVLSSPRERCRETAQPLADRLALPVETDPALDEIDCGDWTGQAFARLADDPRWHAWNAARAEGCIPGGESTAAVRERIVALFERLAGEEGPFVLVSHSDVVKLGVLALVGASPDRHDRIAIDPASVTTLDLWPGGGKVVRLNAEAAA